jgi:hypothetical protein
LEKKMENLKARIAELDAQIKILSEERGQLRQQLAEMQTTLKVGDLVTYEGAKHVWELREIKPGYGSEPKYFGAKLKKDGTPGLHVGEIWHVPYGKRLVVANTQISGGLPSASSQG